MFRYQTAVTYYEKELHTTLRRAGDPALVERGNKFANNTFEYFNNLVLVGFNQSRSVFGDVPGCPAILLESRLRSGCDHVRSGTGSE